MTTPEVDKDLFEEAQAAFTPIVGAPNYDDVKRLNKAFINALQSIDVPGGVINLSGILFSAPVDGEDQAPAAHKNGQARRARVPQRRRGWHLAPPPEGGGHLLQ